jgi:hypothetical protein
MITEIKGTIDHRILLNYRISPEVMAAQLPPEFEPMVVNDWAIGGICQVSLSGMRPKGIPAIVGSRSHNAAHRIAVNSSHGEGVFIPRRDTNSWLNNISGGRLFPGAYKRSKFEVKAEEDRYIVRIRDDGGNPLMVIDGSIVDQLPTGSVFPDTDAVSQFFERGNIGWSCAEKGQGFDAIELRTVEWRMEPLKVNEEFSAYFTDQTKFPAGSVNFDSAMIMRDLGHSWVSKSELRELCC